MVQQHLKNLFKMFLIEKIIEESNSLKDSVLTQAICMNINSKIVFRIHS